MKKKVSKNKAKSPAKTVGFFCNLPPGIRKEIVSRAKKQGVSQGKILVDAIKATKGIELFKFSPVGIDVSKAVIPKQQVGVKVTEGGKVIDSKALKRERDRRYREKKRAEKVPAIATPATAFEVL